MFYVTMQYDSRAMSSNFLVSAGIYGADVCLCHQQVDQAALTGESLPAKKFAGDVCFSGSTIKQGEKHALVYATGKNTFFGRAAALIAVCSHI